MTEVYQVQHAPSSLDVLADELHALFEQKEQSELARLQGLLAFFTSPTCLSHSLAHHFADEQAPALCGHCSVCRGQVAELPVHLAPQLPNEAGIRAWCDPLASLLPQPTPRVLARFLCGISTPLTTRLKAGKLAGFGRLSEVPFAQVMALVTQAYGVQVSK